ncbi:MAG: glycoside hydrolase [Ilumatobacteraceae bacterium]|nr:glycoside hydrolase [Ilumatobacteraceae bacterium]
MRHTRLLLSALVLAAAVVAATQISSDGATVTGHATTTAIQASEAPVLRPTVAPSGEEMPVGNLPGWRQIFTDDFTTPVPVGSFPAAVSSKWTAYPSPWKDTTGYGVNTPLKVDSIADGMLTQYVHTEGNTAMISAIQPKLTANGTTGQLYGRYALRFRTDPLDGYKMAWMLWPDSGQNVQDGEIDFPETNLDSTTVWAFMHRTDNLQTGNDQASFVRNVDLSAWHTAVIEWSPNLVVYKLDGVEIGRTQERIPDTAMHWVLQTETDMFLTAPPDPSVAGNVQIDWVAAWAYDTTTADVTAPSVGITSPAAGASVSGSAVNVPASATDAKGVLGVQFRMDGQNLGPEDTTAPYTASWNSFLVANGSHTLTAVGRDNAGNMGASAPVVVTVNNVADTTAPGFTTNPCQLGCTVFPQDKANLLASFNEQVVGVDGSSFSLKNKNTGEVVPAVVSYASTATTSIATLDPSVVLLADTRYTATLTSAIKDVSGNPITTTSWTFSTGPRPVVTTMGPASSATAVSRTTAVTATFSEAITGVTGNFSLKTAAGAAVPASITYNASTMTATLVPSTPLAANTKYTATLTSNIKDAVTNAINPTSWSFTTGS